MKRGHFKTGKHAITAKFDSVCCETGRPIRKGDVFLYDYTTRKAYASGSPTQAKWYEDNKPDPAGRMLDDMIEQHHENWYRHNYID